MHVQVVVQLLAEEVVEELLYAPPVGLHVLGAELGLGLAFEDGLFDLDADGGTHAVADVSVVVVLPEEVLDDTRYCLLEGREVRTALRGVLPVDEAVEVLAYLRRVRQHDLHVVVLEVDDRVECLLGEVLLEKVS